MNPIDEFLEDHGSNKEASWGDVGKGGLSALGVGLGTAVGGAVIAGGAMGLQKLHDAATKSRDFRKMMEFGADLQDAHKQDPRMFNQMYSSLRNVNPAFAKDPLIAGNYMRKMLGSPEAAGAFLEAAAGSVPGGYGRTGQQIQESASKATGEQFGKTLGKALPRIGG